MLDELFPVQFVEGLNEGAELSEEDAIEIGYSGIGLQYIPQISYILTKLEIMLVFGDFRRKEAQITVGLCSDYNDKPSDIVLTSGSFIPKEVYGGWREVTFQPVSLIKGKNYWVTIYPNGCPTALIRAEKGQGLTLSFKGEKRWRTPPEDKKEGEVMLKFYGRVIPTSG